MFDDLFIHFQQSVMSADFRKLFKSDSDQNFNKLFSTEKVGTSSLPDLVVSHRYIVRNVIEHGILEVFLSVFWSQVCIEPTLLMYED